MGRQSPGKWIRNLLLGKKSSSKSNSSKKRDVLKPSSNKDVLVVSSVASMPSPTVISPPTSGTDATKGVISEKVVSRSSEDRVIDSCDFNSCVKKPSSNKDVLVVSSVASMPSPTVISPPTSRIDATKGVISEKVVSRSSEDRVIDLSTGDEQANAQALVNFCSEDHLEKIRLTEAAITAQAAVRGYQARGTFRTLKGIIPLQALIRGQLVRRQAVSALYCVKGIVKFQALARGYKIRHSDIGLAVQKICKGTKRSNSIGVVTSAQAEKLSDNIYVHKLLASSPSAASLHLKYDLGEPNLAWEWLDRWTRSHFWAPLPELKKLNSVSDEKNDSSQTVETNEGQVKSNAWKAPAVRVNDGSVSDSNRYKRRPKKDSNLPLHSAKEHPQKEIEKINFKKTRMQNVSDRPEIATEKRKHITKKVSDHTVTDVSEQGPGASSEKMKDLAVLKSKQSDPEKSLGQQAEDEHQNVLHNDTNAGLQSSLTNSKDGGMTEDVNVDDNSISNVNPKNFQRRASLPANFNDHDNELHNTPRLPSYMAPTVSTKAKLRGQGSPRFASDLVDKNGITRRLSLSSSLNGKLGSFSPRSERFVAMSSKGLIRTDRSLSSSRDGTDKLIQPQWRR